MTNTSDKYATFVDHPRYGREPHITGLNPKPTEHGVNLQPRTLSPEEMSAVWVAAFGNPYPYAASRPRTDRARRIPNTAIPADISRQIGAAVPVTHYFDLECKCRECGRPFIFFAREQQYWYEELGFSLQSDCLRCVECRKKDQGLARDRERYEALYHVSGKTVDQLLEMAESSLNLIEAGDFATRQTERVRMLLNGVPDHADIRKRRRFKQLIERVLKLEGSD